MPEAIYAPGKSPPQCAAIVERAARQRQRAGAAHPGRPAPGRGRTRSVPGRHGLSPDRGVSVRAHRRHLLARRASHATNASSIVTAGTADLPVAGECAATLRAFGFDAARARRLRGRRRPPPARQLRRARRAPTPSSSSPGWKGRSPSVVGGLVAAPVVAVPTSVGYGAAPRGGDGAARDARQSALPASPSSASTTATAPPAPSPGCSDEPTAAERSPGSTASPASPATWRSAASSTPEPTSTRCAAMLERLPIGGWATRPRDR